MKDRNSNIKHRTSNLALAVGVLLACCRCGLALEPNEIMVVVNGGDAESARLGRYYCERRGVPSENIVSLALGVASRDVISRRDYDYWMAGPLRRELSTRKDGGKIRCLLMTYGVPYKVGRRDPLPEAEPRLKELRMVQQQEKDAVAQLETRGLTGSAEHAERTRKISAMQIEIDRIVGVETDASVDSELSMLLCPQQYELYRWQPNLLYAGLSIQGQPPYKTLMVSRIDGPNYGIAKGLVDKAMAAEANGLVGTAYIDSRGMVANNAYGAYDQSLRDLALLTSMRTKLPVKEETTDALFQPGSCPKTAIYCGWYSVGKYIPAFDFVDGAVGYHIASWEAATLRDPRSTMWCPSMLMAGITATLGPVSEPYLHTFPQPKAFFAELYNGSCLVEAYYRTNPYNSWQMVLVGDPLYRPFRTK